MVRRDCIMARPMPRIRDIGWLMNMLRNCWVLKATQAIEILERIISTRDRPDLLQAIGELYAIAGQAERARDCHEKALEGYLQSAQRGEVLYYHHLADYYADVAKDGAQAVTWARADLQLRENYSTQ